MLSRLTRAARGRGRSTALVVAALAAVVACSSNPVSTPSPRVTCPPPPPVAFFPFGLAYPEPGASAVPINVGLLIFAGPPQNYDGTYAITMTSPTGSVPVGAFTAAPSPMPTPYATPTNYPGPPTFEAAPIPTLSPATSYSVSYTEKVYSNTPPACTATNTLPLGSFTTQ